MPVTRQLALASRVPVLAAMTMPVRLALAAWLLPAAGAAVSFSAGFSDDAVFQRSATKGTAVYGFAASAAPVKVTVSSSGGASYTVSATPTPWVDTSGCNATSCIDAKTPLPPAHGAFQWRAELKPQTAAGGSWTISATDGSAEQHDYARACHVRRRLLLQRPERESAPAPRLSTPESYQSAWPGPERLVRAEHGAGDILHVQC